MPGAALIGVLSCPKIDSRGIGRASVIHGRALPHATRRRNLATSTSVVVLIVAAGHVLETGGLIVIHRSRVVNLPQIVAVQLLLNPRVVAVVTSRLLIDQRSKRVMASLENTSALVTVHC